MSGVHLVVDSRPQPHQRQHLAIARSCQHTRAEHLPSMKSIFGAALPLPKGPSTRQEPPGHSEAVVGRVWNLQNIHPLCCGASARRRYLPNTTRSGRNPQQGRHQGTPGRQRGGGCGSRSTCIPMAAAPGSPPPSAFFPARLSTCRDSRSPKNQGGATSSVAAQQRTCQSGAEGRSFL